MQTNEELATAAQAGNSEAINQLWEQCMGFICKCALKWAYAWRDRPSCEADDFIQCGYFALLEAVKAFQAGRGSFMNILAYHIKTEFSKCAGCRTSAQMKEPLNNAISLDAPVGNDTENEITLGDTIPGNDTGIEDIEEQMFRETIEKKVREAVFSLPERQSMAVNAYYLEGKTARGIGEAINATPQRSAQIVKDGLHTLRTGSRAPDLYELLYNGRNLYRRTGYSAWKNTGCSVEEWELLRKEEKMQGLNKRREKIRYCVRVLGMDQSEAEALFPV